jgi:hypothetical protein
VQLGRVQFERVGREHGDVGELAGRERALLVRRAGRTCRALGEGAQGFLDRQALLGTPPAGRAAGV